MINLLSAAHCAFALAVALGSLPAQQQPKVLRHLVEVRVDDHAALDRLLALDLDLAACQAIERPARIVEVIARGDADLDRLRAIDLTFQVVIRDLEAYHARELARFGPFSPEVLTPPIGQGAMGGHYTLAQMEAILDGFRRDHPTICSQRTSIGRSIEGRDIWVVKISDNVNTSENEARAYFDALHHAREPVSMAATLAFMDWLLTDYGTDPNATFLIDERELFFVPCVNPDGYEYNRATNPGGGGMWRKNRRDNGDGTHGVDLNRNYATGWNAPNGGNSTNTSSDVYRGTAPFSEPETTAVEAFVTGMGFAVACSTHTYTDVLLHPWGYLHGAPANAADYDALGPRMVDDNGIAYGAVSTLLYIAAGGGVDHFHAAHGAISWTPELGRSDEGGFWPTPPNQIAIVDRYLTMFRDMALSAGSLVEVGDVTITEEPGGNGNGAVGPGETGAVAVTVRNDGLAAAPGAVQITVTSQTTGVIVLAGQTTAGALPPLSSSNTAPGTLRVQVAPGFGGAVATLRVTAIGGGRTATRDVDFRTAPLRIAVDDDMERDRGFARDTGGTARTGLFERAAPQQTTYGGQAFQPGSDHSPSGTLCWVTDARAGSSVGQYDVDGGYTDMISPELDLSHLGYAELAFWRWYAESVGNDRFEVAVRRQGGVWTTLLSDARSTNGWIDQVLPIPTPLTDRMQFRFRAQDLNASLVEAAVDDLRILGVGPDAGVLLLSSGDLGTDVRIGLTGMPNALVTPIVGPRLGGPVTIPGVGGTLYIDPVLIIEMPGVPLDGDGAGAVDITIPIDPNLRGVSLHWQAVQAGLWTFGNVQSITFR